MRFPLYNCKYSTNSFKCNQIMILVIQLLMRLFNTKIKLNYFKQPTFLSLPCIQFYYVFFHLQLFCVRFSRSSYFNPLSLWQCIHNQINPFFYSLNFISPVSSLHSTFVRQLIAFECIQFVSQQKRTRKQFKWISLWNKPLVLLYI